MERTFDDVSGQMLNRGHPADGRLRGSVLTGA